MASQKLNIQVDQGTDFTETVVAKNADGSILDMTGYTAAGQIRKTYASNTSTEFVVTFGDRSAGEVIISLVRSQTSSLEAGRYVYDVEITSSADKRARLVEGQVTVTQEVTRAGPIDYIDEVNITNPVDGAFLVYDSTTSKWIDDATIKKGSSSLVEVTGTLEADGFSGTSGVTITDFTTDVSFADATNVNVPTAAAVKSYVDTVSATQDTLGEMDDTYIVSPSSAQFLIYDGTDTWDNKSITGDVTFTSEGVSAIQPNSVALGTDTTGDYVGTITGGTGVDSTAATSGEGTTHTLSVDLNELGTETSIAQDDFIAMVDATDSGSQKITFSDLEDEIFGNVSGDIAIAAGGAATIQATSVENSMLAGSITNGKLLNSTITVSDGSNTSDLALGDTLTFAGTANEVTVAESAGTVTVGLSDSINVNVVQAAQSNIINGASPYLNFFNSKTIASGLTTSSTEFTGVIPFYGIAIDTDNSNAESYKPSGRIFSKFTNCTESAIAGQMVFEVTKAGATNWSMDTPNPKNVMVLEPGTVTIGVGGTENALDLTDLAVNGDASVSGDLVVTGDLTVNGTETVINSTTLSVDDKNIVLGSVATPTDTTADGGGITLKGATDKTINWVNSTDSWTSSENFELASSKSFRINANEVLNQTTLGSTVLASSLTSVGTIGTGTWQGTAIANDYIGDHSADKLTTGTLASDRISGSYTGITGIGTIPSLSVLPPSGTAGSITHVSRGGSATFVLSGVGEVGDAGYVAPGNFTVSGATTATVVAPSITLVGALGVTGATTITGDSTLVGALGVKGATTVAGDVGITGDSTLEGALGVKGATTVAGTVGITGDSTLEGALGVKGATTVAGAVGITGDSTLVGALGVKGATTLTGDVGITGDSTLVGALGVKGATTLTGDVGITGDSTLTGAVGITGDSTLEGALGVKGATTVAGAVGITGDSTLVGALGVKGATTIAGDSTITGAVGITGATTLTGAATVKGATSIQNTLGVTGATTLSGTLSAGVTTLDSVQSNLKTNIITATTLSVTKASHAGTKIIFTGTSASTFSFPAVVVGDVGDTFTIVNAGTASITNNVNGSDKFVKLVLGSDPAEVSTITLAKGGVAEFVVTAAGKIAVFGSGIS